MKSLEHSSLLNFEYCRGFCCGRCANPQRLPDQASFTEKITRPQYAQYCFLPLSRGDSDFHPARLNKIDGVPLVSLRKEFYALPKFQYLLTLDNVFEHALDISIDFCGFELCDLLRFSHSGRDAPGSLILDGCALSGLHSQPLTVVVGKFI